MDQKAKFTYEEWALLEKAKRMEPDEGEKLVLAFYKKRLALMCESDQPLPSELEKECSYEEYLQKRYFVSMKEGGYQ